MPFGRKGRKNQIDESYTSVIDGIKKIYDTKLKKLETDYKYDYLISPTMRPADFDAKPMVLFLGQYSTGKTTFINYLLNYDYPGSNIGPEPTTDGFAAIMHGPTNGNVPGNTLCVQTDKPFTNLARFGNDFMAKFSGAYCNLPLLEHMTFIDSPGVLSGEKQRIGRSYDFNEVVRWFAERADMIVLVFDAHKLDISDEFKGVIESVKKHSEKMKIVLNKADSIDSQQLMRVYGALMWSLGKVMQTPECLRVYVSSFWDQPFKDTLFTSLFEKERDDLMYDLHALPKQATVRKVNELCKRARLAKTNAYITSYLREQMPTFGKEKKKAELIADLNNVFNIIMRKYNLAAGDFPPIQLYKEKLNELDFTKFPKLDTKLIASIDDVLGTDIPMLLKKYPMEDSLSSSSNPFEASTGYEKCMDILEVTDDEIFAYQKEFDKLPKNEEGKVNGKDCFAPLMATGADKKALKKIWSIADSGKNGSLNAHQYILAKVLVRSLLQNGGYPDDLPPVE
ncbi:EH-domain containing protein putative [Entamoeba histolytica]|uniref:EH-domain containing protein, putative n=4 Tax=Entamoeba histolytica TaxID=5759 RepID=C4LSV2_ENTH1|nr:EH-domain containing protein, putative [Entamoeba histolytica HM-1:IMSS]EAL50295.1 EH-domain containing protein, putative [Entamoeba histolytica HM-1:IMSS]EMD45247.1 EH domain containing protein [Entamoeba histolytica KU27]ENY66013.1 receptor mediated endocytosis protein, putative [Entamoeba histolytica HM-1:IMSS-A]GAT91521.1 EH-domain containing protein putative [Entamoeba histolytica]|eukprot:XP_655680.1 EH-domain containing protein, putative [Entamoeba histolytica HM-1:IMSS]